MRMFRFFCVAVLLFMSSAVSADPAVIYDGFVCSSRLPAIEGNTLGDVVVISNAMHEVATDKGVINLTCHFEHNEELPYATSARGFDCWIADKKFDFFVTTNSMMLATPGGRAVMVCKYKSNPQE